jgi:hypothetical protein
MDIRTWNEKNYTDDEVTQMWFEYRFVKQQLKEVE